MSYENKLSGRLEDYIEAIYLTSLVQNNVRSKTIMEHFQVSGSSVTEALHVLRSKNFIIYQPCGLIILTPTGRKLARDVMRRHEIIKEFLIDVLKIEQEVADKSACLMGHAVTPIIVERMICYISYLKSRCGKCGAAPSNDFGQYIQD
jgi:DtxR family Mn-dependent transcriptional regulator